jgi:hypothetical protein
MISEDSTRAKNEIYRKIKLYKAKETNLKNFTRKKKDEILSDRIERQKKTNLMLVNDSSMTTLSSVPCATKDASATKTDRQNLTNL